MSWQNLLAKDSVNAHQTSQQEIENLRELVNRDLKDAEIVGLSNLFCTSPQHREHKTPIFANIFTK